MESNCWGGGGGVMKKMERRWWSRRTVVGWTGVAVGSMDICLWVAEK